MQASKRYPLLTKEIFLDDLLVMSRNTYKFDEALKNDFGLEIPDEKIKKSLLKYLRKIEK